MSARLAPRSLALAVLTACPAIAFAFNYQITDRICVPDVVPPRIEKPVPVPVGCKLIDCCPGCPGSGPLEWRVTVNAKVLQGAELRFEGMGAAELKKLKITGNARVDGDRIILRRGDSRIRGIPDRIGGKVVVGSLSPVASRDAGARLRSLPSGTPASRSSRGPGSITDHIFVRQFLGPVPVNDFRWRHIIRPCPASGKKPRVPWDMLEVKDYTPGEPLVVMMDARTAAGTTGCRDGSDGSEWVFTATPGPTGVIELPNLRAPVGCNSEVVIFSQNHKMHFDRDVTSWTNGTGNVHPVRLEPLINVPITVWIADAAAAARAADEVNNANFLYRQNRVGIQLDPKYEDKSGDPAAVTVINNGIGLTPLGRKACLDLQGLKDKGLYTEKALNIYYIDLEMEGRNCAIRKTPSSCPATGDGGDGNVTFVGNVVNLAVVAHELGHAFGLRPGPCWGHTSEENTAGDLVNLPGFDDDNIMRADAYGLVNHFTLGQVFRMNTHDDEWGGTMLIENGHRPVPDRRPCPPKSDPGKLCPVLKTDLP